MPNTVSISETPEYLLFTGKDRASVERALAPHLEGGATMLHELSAHGDAWYAALAKPLDQACRVQYVDRNVLLRGPTCGTLERKAVEFLGQGATVIAPPVFTPRDEWLMVLEMPGL